MAGKKVAANKQSKYATADGHSYLTKRITVSMAQAAGRQAASDAMRIMGFVVVAEGANIVKKYADGRIEIITAI